MRFLIQFGYAHDPRVRQAIDWLLPIQRDDGMWFCRGAEGRGRPGEPNKWLTLDALRVIKLLVGRG